VLFLNAAVVQRESIMSGRVQYSETMNEREFVRLLQNCEIVEVAKVANRLVQEIQKEDSKINWADAVHFAPWALCVYLQYREPHPGTLRKMCANCIPGRRNYHTLLASIILLLKDGRVGMSSKLRAGTRFEKTVREALEHLPHFEDLEAVLRISGACLD